LGNLDGFKPDEQLLDYEQLLELDRWALNRLAATIDVLDKGYDRYDFVQVFKKVYSFCNEELSSIYLDILKDRLYTFPAHSKERLSAQTVLYYILDSLTRILAPLMSFTAEETRQAAPRPSAEATGSVHCLSWPQPDQRWANSQIEEKFRVLLEMRGFVLKALDEQRKSGKIGSGLQAKVVLATASNRDFEYFSSFKDILATIFIVSQVELRRVPSVSLPLSDYFSQTELHVASADGLKCARCWNWRIDVGESTAHPTLCARCAQVVEQEIQPEG
jgi:isoleucyl-tRNA synthetase